MVHKRIRKCVSFKKNAANKEEKGEYQDHQKKGDSKATKMIVGS
jgi:hypothetical protein